MDLICVHPRFDSIWPWAADHFHDLWRAQGPTRATTPVMWNELAASDQPVEVRIMPD